MWFSVNHKLWKLSNSEHFFEFVNSCFVVHMSSKLLTLPVLTNTINPGTILSFLTLQRRQCMHKTTGSTLHGFAVDCYWTICLLSTNWFVLLFVCHVYSPTISATASTWVCWSRCAAIDTRNTCVMTWPAYRKNVWKRYGTFMPWWSVTFAGVIHWPCQSGYDDIYKYIVYIIKGCCINASISV